MSMEEYVDIINGVKSPQIQPQASLNSDGSGHSGHDDIEDEPPITIEQSMTDNTHKTPESQLELDNEIKQPEPIKEKMGITTATIWYGFDINFYSKLSLFFIYFYSKICNKIALEFV